MNINLSCPCIYYTRDDEIHLFKFHERNIVLFMTCAPDNGNECPCHVTRLVVICLCCVLSSAPGSTSDSSCLWRLIPPTGSEKTNDVGHLRPGRGLLLFVCGDMTLCCLSLSPCCHVTPLMRSSDVIRCGEKGARSLIQATFKING